MAEAIGLAASIIQIAGAGTKLSTSLYNFASSAVRADREVEDLANDVANTSMVLSSVGCLFEGDKTKNIIKKEAIQHAKNLIDQCERIFADINKVVDKRRCISKDGKKARLTFRGKMGWPLKEQKLQFQKARLESLKSSLNMLLQVIELAESQSRGTMDPKEREEQKQKIRETHQHSEDTKKLVQILADKLNIDDDETLNGSSSSTRAGTLNFMTLGPQVSAGAPEGNETNNDATPADDSDTSESDGTVADTDEEHLTMEELSKCAEHVHKLLKRISSLQDSISAQKVTKNPRYPKRRVHKIYRRFCQRFESEIVSVTARKSVAPQALPNSHASTSVKDVFGKYKEIPATEGFVGGRSAATIGAAESGIGQGLFPADPSFDDKNSMSPPPWDSADKTSFTQTGNDRGTSCYTLDPEPPGNADVVLPSENHVLPPRPRASMKQFRQRIQADKDTRNAIAVTEGESGLAPNRLASQRSEANDIATSPKSWTPVYNSSFATRKKDGLGLEPIPNDVQSVRLPVEVVDRNENWHQEWKEPLVSTQQRRSPSVFSGYASPVRRTGDFGQAFANPSYDPASTRSPNPSNVFPIPSTNDFNNVFANPPYDHGFTRARTSSNASFIEPWTYPSRALTATASTMAYTWASNDKVETPANLAYMNAFYAPTWTGFSDSSTTKQTAALSSTDFEPMTVGQGSQVPGIAGAPETNFQTGTTDRIILNDKDDPLYSEMMGGLSGDGSSDESEEPMSTDLGACPTLYACSEVDPATKSRPAVTSDGSILTFSVSAHPSASQIKSAEMVDPSGSVSGKNSSGPRHALLSDSGETGRLKKTEAQARADAAAAHGEAYPPPRRHRTFMTPPRPLSRHERKKRGKASRKDIAQLRAAAAAAETPLHTTTPSQSATDVLTCAATPLQAPVKAASGSEAGLDKLVGSKRRSSNNPAPARQGASTPTQRPTSLSDTPLPGTQDYQHHELNDAPVCGFPDCGKTFYRLDLLQRHQERHNEIGKDSRRSSLYESVTGADTRVFSQIEALRAVDSVASPTMPQISSSSSRRQLSDLPQMSSYISEDINGEPGISGKVAESSAVYEKYTFIESDEIQSRRHRGRKRALTAEQRRDALVMRDSRACSNCRKRKAKCDSGIPCRACIDYFKHDLVRNPCRDQLFTNPGNVMKGMPSPSRKRVTFDEEPVSHERKRLRQVVAYDSTSCDSSMEDVEVKSLGVRDADPTIHPSPNKKRKMPIKVADSIGDVFNDVLAAEFQAHSQKRLRSSSHEQEPRRRKSTMLKSPPASQSPYPSADPVASDALSPPDRSRSRNRIRAKSDPFSAVSSRVPTLSAPLPHQSPDEIRLTQRNEAREREARRQARREARARGDTDALAEIRQQAEAAADMSVSQTLNAEHQAANRKRRVSGVQYAELGVQYTELDVQLHNRTRIRANSSESDNRPLLDSAASISRQSARSRAFSNTNTLGTHYRVGSPTIVEPPAAGLSEPLNQLLDTEKPLKRTGNWGRPKAPELDANVAGQGRKIAPPSLKDLHISSVPDQEPNQPYYGLWRERNAQSGSERLQDKSGSVGPINTITQPSTSFPPDDAPTIDPLSSPSTPASNRNSPSSVHTPYYDQEPTHSDPWKRNRTRAPASSSPMRVHPSSPSIQPAPTVPSPSPSPSHTKPAAPEPEPEPEPVPKPESSGFTPVDLQSHLRSYCPVTLPPSSPPLDTENGFAPFDPIVSPIPNTYNSTKFDAYFESAGAWHADCQSGANPGWTGSGALAKRRSPLNPDAINHLQAWLDAHESNPYPTADEKTQLAKHCDVAEKQVATWFTNARARRLERGLGLSSGDEGEEEAGGEGRLNSRKNWRGGMSDLDRAIAGVGTDTGMVLEPVMDMNFEMDMGMDLGMDAIGMDAMGTHAMRMVPMGLGKAIKDEYAGKEEERDIVDILLEQWTTTTTMTTTMTPPAPDVGMGMDTLRT